ncbi:MAG: hypothetical protein EBV03_06500 [Proteobacteria bacterium]|nr:hypothetical protein [Pseudomonadota bacterium]
MPQHKAFRALQRIFGSDSVNEVFCSPRLQRREQWCYEVIITPDENLRPATTTAPYHPQGSLGLNLQTYLRNRLGDEFAHFDNASAFRIGNDSEELEPLRFLIPVNEAEKPEQVKKLERISPDCIRNAMVMPEHDRLREAHSAALRAATHDMIWQFVSGRDGEGYQTVEPVKNPDAMQIAILTKLGLKDADYHVASLGGHACISLRAMLDGQLRGLVEGIVPKACCVPVSANRYGR